MSRFLITGSTGFLGAAITARLTAAGHIVTGIDPAGGQIANDLSNPTTLAAIVADARPDYVIHAGGVSGPMVPTPPADIMAINVAGSVNLIQASVAVGVKRFVFCSSISAVGPFTGGPLPDDAPLKPSTPYGASKAAMDHVLQGLNGRIPMQFCSLRLTAIYGPGRRTESPFTAMIAAARAGRPLAVPAEPAAQPYIYIDDAADAAIAACLTPTLTQLFYNIAHPQMVSLQDIAAALAIAGHPVELTPDPTLPIVRRGSLATEAATRDLGFTARIDLQDAIHRMLAV